jgi:hypothetical protein
MKTDVLLRRVGIYWLVAACGEEDVQFWNF